MFLIRTDVVNLGFTHTARESIQAGTDQCIMLKLSSAGDASFQASHYVIEDLHEKDSCWPHGLVYL